MSAICSHADWEDWGPKARESGRVRCARCCMALDYYGDPDGPMGTVHRFPDQSMALAIVQFLRPHLDAIAEGLKADGTLHPTVVSIDLYAALVDRINGYFADRPENPVKVTAA